MHPDDTPGHKTLVADLSDALIRLGLIAFLVILCARLFAPFLSLILAVTLYPLHQMIAVRLGNRQGRAATLLVLAALVLIGVPTLLLGSSFVTFLQELHSQYVVGFTPAVLDGKVHKLEVRLKKPGLSARARKSYLATADVPGTRPRR